ncbi:DUF1499 domain-containing protein [Devosia albogilva]|uniref:DUF1499 domain-containing protein n=1 Tax=Devosia albogilva TaxID=429726 RepID=A0ABW5QMF8_9HYPH
MRILIRTSRWAIWARRLGNLAIPMVVLPIVLMWMRLISGDVFLVAEIAAAAVAAMAVLAALVALVRLWQSGDLGWDRALLGLLFGTLALLPFAWHLSLALRYPQVTDIATVERGELPLIFDPVSRSMPTPHVLSTAEAAAVFPNVHTRTYPLGQVPAYSLIRQMVMANGWEIIAEREPGADFSPGRINARVAAIPGWREEVVIRVTGGMEESTVDMRSASLDLVHDFGGNGRRIESFLVALDDAVTTLLRDNPNANQPLEAEPELPEEPEAE